MTMLDRFYALAFAAVATGAVGCDIELMEGNGVLILIINAIVIMAIYLLYKHIDENIYSSKVYLNKNFMHDNPLINEPVCLVPRCNSSKECALHITNDSTLSEGYIMPLDDMEISNNKKCRYFKSVYDTF